MLRGNAPATIDEKGRLKIPSNFRAHIEESWGSDYYVTSLSGESVLIYPLPIWQEIEERTAKLPSLNPTKKKFLDRTNYYGQVTSVDKSGRVLISAAIARISSDDGRSRCPRYLDHLDVWNHKRFLGRIRNMSSPRTIGNVEQIGNLMKSDLMLLHTPVLLAGSHSVSKPGPAAGSSTATVGAEATAGQFSSERRPRENCWLSIKTNRLSRKQKDELASFGSRVVFVHSNFREVALVAAEHGFSECDGVLADIGISSMMVDDPSRGFSFMREGPLDMRMDRTQPLTAVEVVNTYSEKILQTSIHNLNSCNG